jgi:uroporphyrinogen decarboxylase
VRSFIPDFIETGIDILNPVQKSAAGMDLAALKQEFGSELVFWGGGVDTQQVFDRGSVEDVRQDVGESIAALKPGGGFVFTPVHNTQPTVQPENYLAMWETLKIHWRY